MANAEALQSLVGNTFNANFYVGQVTMLTAEREKELWERWKDQKDYAARETFLKAYLPLCMRLTYEVAKNNAYQGDLMLDLFGEAQAEMVRLFDKGTFDPELGRFSSLAIPSLKGVMISFVMDNKAPFKMCTTKMQKYIFNNISRAESKLDKEFPHMPAHVRHEKIAEILGSCAQGKVTTEDVQDFVLRRKSVGLSADSPAFGSEDNETLVDRAPSEDNSLSILEQEDRQRTEQLMHQAIEKLDSRSRDVIRERFLNPEQQTLQQLALKYNVSHERIRQIETAALKKLRAEMTGDLPPRPTAQARYIPA